MIRQIKELMNNERIERCKRYAQAIGLGKGEWVKVFIDYMISHICYKFTALDYFVIGNGYTLSRYEKKRFYTEQRAWWLWNKVNDPKYIHFLKNKVETLEFFSDFVSREWLYAPKSSFSEFMDFINKTPVFIAKPVDKYEGEGIEKYSTSGVSEEDLKTLYNHLVSNGMLLEECLKAHDDIYLGTKSLNTFRLYTMMDGKGDVHVLKAKYRAGTGDAITDTASGCIAYPISIEYGVIEGPGINEVLNSKNYFYHPGSDKLVVGMKIPMWDRVLEVVTEAAKKIPQVRYIGWDLAVTNDGVEIIEGNNAPWTGTFEIMGIERLWWPKIKALL
jgi:hypothetical protein